MSLLDVARTRYTTKHYDPAKRVSDADFADLLEVLRLAPTSVNAQATRYFVADNAAAKEKILPAILDFNRPRVTESSHTIVFAVKAPSPMPTLRKSLPRKKPTGDSRTRGQRPFRIRAAATLPGFLPRPRAAATPGPRASLISRWVFCLLRLLKKALTPRPLRGSILPSSMKFWVSGKKACAPLPL